MSDLIFPPVSGGGGSNTTIYRFTDSTDISIPTTQAGAAQIGQSVSMDIPTSGVVDVLVAKTRIDATAAATWINPALGLKIGGTVYPLVTKQGASISSVALDSVNTGLKEDAYNGTNRASIEYMVSAHSLPTGQQTVSLVVFESDGDSGGVLEGTTFETVIALAITDCTGG
jgi:hypothetical protein